MNTSRKLHQLAALGMVVALSTSLTACATGTAGPAATTPTPVAKYEPLWKSAPHWSQLHLCADDREHTGASDTFAHAWRECVVLMSLAEPPASAVRGPAVPPSGRDESIPDDPRVTDHAGLVDHQGSSER